MFGYLLADPAQLTEEEAARYKACYCGLCRSLGERHGQLSRMSLTYDMTFLILLLNSLYEPEEKTGEGLCLPHPRKPHQWLSTEITDYAADMNVALAYLKCLDDWEDDGSPAALAEAGLFKAAYERVLACCPRQCAAIQESLSRLHVLEREKQEDPDAASACFGRLMGEVFVYREDRWSSTLRALGDSLGRFLYVMDACMDLDSDSFRGRYNPFRRYYGLPDNERRFRALLKMLLGDSLRDFDRLPLLQDLGIMQNILCAGVWAQFDKKFGCGKEPEHGTGSV